MSSQGAIYSKLNLQSMSSQGAIYSKLNLQSMSSQGAIYSKLNLQSMSSQDAIYSELSSSQCPHRMQSTWSPQVNALTGCNLLRVILKSMPSQDAIYLESSSQCPHRMHPLEVILVTAPKLTTPLPGGVYSYQRLFGSKINKWCR